MKKLLEIICFYIDTLKCVYEKKMQFGWEIFNKLKFWKFIKVDWSLEIIEFQSLFKKIKICFFFNILSFVFMLA